MSNVIPFDDRRKTPRRSRDVKMLQAYHISVVTMLQLKIKLQQGGSMTLVEREKYIALLKESLDAFSAVGITP